MTVHSLKPCPYCGRKPIIEHWSSGGRMYMVKCNTPDCLHLEMYPKGHLLIEVMAEWDRRVFDIVRNSEIEKLRKPIDKEGGKGKR